MKHVASLLQLATSTPGGNKRITGRILRTLREAKANNIESTRRFARPGTKKNVPLNQSKATLEKRWKLRLHRSTLALTVVVGISLFSVASFEAQTPTRGRAPVAAPANKGTPAARVQANLAQLMRGTLCPSSNVIFAAQSENPADMPPAKDPSTATNPLASSYGKWQAVENSALAIAEVANLLILPGRKCSNGEGVPLRNADWTQFVQGLRDAGMTAYAARNRRTKTTF